MHSYVCYCLFLGQEWSQDKLCEIILIYHVLTILIFCYAAIV